MQTQKTYIVEYVEKTVVRKEVTALSGNQAKDNIENKKGDIVYSRCVECKVSHVGMITADGTYKDITN